MIVLMATWAIEAVGYLHTAGVVSTKPKGARPHDRLKFSQLVQDRHMIFGIYGRIIGLPRAVRCIALKH